MGKIEYTSLSGMSRRISDDFKTNAMGYIWHLYSTESNPKLKNLLDELHCVVSAVLYGTISKEGDK